MTGAMHGRKVIGVTLIALVMLSLMSVSIGITESRVIRNNNKYAVLVGVGKTTFYPNENIACDNDAELMSSVLVRKYGFNSQAIKLLTNEEATKANIMASLRWMIDNTDENSTIVFMFSGHGGYDALGLYDSCLYSSELVTLFNQLKSQKIFILLIACHSGSFIPDLDGPGRVVVTSCPAESYSGVGNRYSIYAYYFIYSGMKQGLADLNGDAFTSIEEAANYTTSDFKYFGPVSDNYPDEMFL